MRRAVPRGGVSRRADEAPLPRLRPAKAVVAPGGIRLGDVAYKCSSLEIEAEAGGQVRVGGRGYPGTIRLLRSADRVTVIVVLDVERYLLSVVGGEMPADWPAEALKAQAVAARTLAIFYHLQRAALEYDLTSTVEDQVYAAGKAKPSIVEAVGRHARRGAAARRRTVPGVLSLDLRRRDGEPGQGARQAGIRFPGGRAVRVLHGFAAL